MPSPRYVLELYVTGSSALSEQAIASLQRLRADDCATDWDVRVIDVLEEPGKAEEAHVVATPTLLRVVPAPERRIIGDLSDVGQTLAALGLPQQHEATDGRAGEVERGV